MVYLRRKGFFMCLKRVNMQVYRVYRLQTCIKTPDMSDSTVVTYGIHLEKTIFDVIEQNTRDYDLVID